ncbi:DnaJ sub B member 6-A [Bulinus truncatus]|nr:DnaJ sub B member 6-A [Bulinus truncatus]
MPATRKSNISVDYYEVLGIEKSSTEQEVKKAYRRLALKWHPDKNPDNKDEAKKKFQEISEAYDVLSDKQKRDIYDRYGKEGIINGAHRGDEDFNFEPSGFGAFHFQFRSPEEIFRDFFGTDDPFASFFGVARRNGNTFESSFPGFPHGNSFSSSFFSQDPFASSGFGRPMRRRRGEHSRGRLSGLHMHHHPFLAFSPRIHFGFPMMSMMSDPFFGFSGATNAGISHFSSTSFGGPTIGGNFRSTSTSTKIVNGKRIVTKKVVENGQETVMIEEDGVLKSKSINGVPQALDGPTSKPSIRA